MFLCFSALASADQTIRYRNAKTIAVGGAKIAGGFDYNGFVFNPALLSRVHILRFSVNLPISLDEDILEVSKFISDNQDKFEDYDELTSDDKTAFLEDMKDIDSKWGRIAVSPMVSIATNIKGYGLGLAVYTNNLVNMKVDRGIYEPRVWGSGGVDLAVVLGFAKPLFFLYPGLTVGANVKYLKSQHVDLFQIPASDLGSLSDTMTPIIDEAKETERNIYAVDVGALLELPVINADVGATMKSMGDGRGASLDIGIAKRMFSDRITILADYLDFYDNNKENVFKKIHMGAQFKYLFLALRGGFNQGYPAYGIGLDFRILDIDAAYYTEELSKGPGVNEDNRYIAQIKFGW